MTDAHMKADLMAYQPLGSIISFMITRSSRSSELGVRE